MKTKIVFAAATAAAALAAVVGFTVVEISEAINSIDWSQT